MKYGLLILVGFLAMPTITAGFRFDLYTPRRGLSPYVLDARTVPSDFNRNGKVAVIIHGFTDSANAQWVKMMARELLAVSVPNVIGMDWKYLARGVNYFRAASNTKPAGARLATLIRTLGVDPGQVHLIGHSLGAQVAGFAGAMFGSRKIGRISGLDPASPLFEEKRTTDKLDRSDAIFVDVIHTDARKPGQNAPLGIDFLNAVHGLGVRERTGHVDFYPNGGSTMPGCGHGVLSILPTKETQCSHGRARDYFTASIRANFFTAYPCPTQSSWARCNRCGSGCNRMGYYATPRPAGLFVLRTSANYPFLL